MLVGNAAHLVVNRRHHRNRFTGHVHVGEVDADLVHRRQTLHDRLGTQVVELQQHVVLVGTTTAAFLDFLVHAARDEIARRQVLQRGRIPLHEALAVAVDQDRALAAAAFGQQHAGTGDTGRVELPELHVFERQAGAGGHAQAVAGVDEGIGGGGKNAAGASGRQHRGLGLKNVQFAGFHFECGHANHVAFGVANQVQRHPFDEERVCAPCTFCWYSVCNIACPVRSAAAQARSTGLFAVVGGVSAERTLVDRAVGVAVERHAHVFQVVDDLGRFTAHELDRILVAQPVRALDRVVEMVVPVVFVHVAQGRADAALGGHRVGAGGETPWTAPPRSGRRGPVAAMRACRSRRHR
jgi:hypothetical protein